MTLFIILLIIFFSVFIILLLIYLSSKILIFTFQIKYLWLSIIFGIFQRYYFISFFLFLFSTSLWTLIFYYAYKFVAFTD